MLAVKNLLEGKPFRSPLHPALVHVPVALLPLSLLLDFASRWYPSDDSHLVRGAFAALVAGIVTAVVAALFGLVDYSEIRADHPAKSKATQHMVLNGVAVLIFGVSAWLRRDQLDAASTAILPIVFSFVGVALISYSGYLGGHLVYSDGIGVGRHRRRTRTPVKTLRVAASGRPSVEVASASALRDGETLRVDVGGTVLAIARLQGKLYAFQEFCTHRYGPLSEGKLAECEVTCPWHGSRFDVRTGAVTGGPAKVPLKTFAVEQRDGKIYVESPRSG